MPIWLKDKEKVQINRTWTLAVNIRTSSFESMKNAIAQVFHRLEQANHYKEFNMAGGGGGGGGGGPGHNAVLSTSFDVSLHCPIEDEIAELRRQADMLEQSIK